MRGQLFPAPRSRVCAMFTMSSVFLMFSMFSWTPLTFAAPIALACAAGGFAIALATVLVRRIAMPRTAIVLLSLGGACAALAAGDPMWRSPRRASRVVVMVDISPSTRSATFRRPDALRQRAAQLLGNTPFDIVTFPGNGQLGGRDTQYLQDARVEQTRFDPPAGADAIVLFSDARFDPPPDSTVAPLPPVLCVIDPNLDVPSDSAIERLDIRGGDQIGVTSSAPAAGRDLIFMGATTKSVQMPVGHTVTTSRLASGVDEAIVMLSPPRDDWPENDVLGVRRPPPQTLEQWWVGDSPAPPGWKHLKPEEVATEPADYLAAAAIVLDDVPVERLLRPQQARLLQYVRDLGGGLVILGGEHAFAAGGYPGTPLEQVSPLSSSPPNPTTHWILLADASGSMAASIGDNTKLAFATLAMRQLVPLLPPDDPVSLGSFARELRWWSRGRIARQLDPVPAHPLDLRPQGPTDLAPALSKIAVANDASMPTELLLITDAETKFDDPASLAAVLTRDRIRVHLLGTKDIDPANPVRRIVAKTGGTYLSSTDPRQWVATLRTLMRTVTPPRVERSPLLVHFSESGGESAGAATRTVNPWNRTWLKPMVTEIATGESNGQTVPAVAAWKLGEGAAIATAFPTDAAVAQTLARRVVLPPRDPRLKVTWDAGPKLSVTIDAADRDQPLNNLDLHIDIFPAGGGGTSSATRPATFEIPQTGPGRYAISLPAPRVESFARVRRDNLPIDRISTPGRYAPEFDAIGNDREAMKRLAAISGGEVVEPKRKTPLELRLPRRELPLRTFLALAAATFCVAGLVRWRMS